MKKVAEWQGMAVRARTGMPEKLTQEEFARALGVSTSEVRRWEQGKRAPTASQAILLGKVVGLPDCWFWWGLAGLPKEEVERVFTRNASPGGEKKKARRYSEETRMELHAALDSILDHARTDIAERFIADLDKFAGRFGGPKD